MNKIERLLAICFTIFLLLLIGCTEQEPKEKEFKEVPYEGQLEGKFIEIHYLKGPGQLGWAKEINFSNDGTVMHKEGDFIIEGTDTTIQNKKIERTELENLAFQIQRLGFFELQDSYNCMEDHSLKQNCAYDSYNVVITVTIENQTKKVKEYDYSGPQAFRYIENLIEGYSELAVPIEDKDKQNYVKKGYVGDVLLVTGMVDQSYNVTLEKGFQLEDVPANETTEGECFVRTLDKQENPLSEVYFKTYFELYSEGGSIETEYSPFLLIIPFSLEVNSIQVLCRDEVRAEITVSENAPTVSIISPLGGEEWLNGVHLIEWEANDLDGDELEYVLNYSGDNGETWGSLGINLTETKYYFDVGMVDGGNNYKIRVMATDGVLTNKVVSETFTILNPNIDVPLRERNLGTINDLSNVVLDFNVSNTGNADLELFDLNYSDNVKVTGLELPLILVSGELKKFKIELLVNKMHLGGFSEEIGISNSDPNQIVKRIVLNGILEEAKSDLTVEREEITFVPENLEKGENVLINALVENLGDLEAKNIKVDFYANDYSSEENMIGTENIAFIDSNSSKEISVEWNNIKGGEYAIYIIIDKDDLINEKNEENNIISKSVSVASEPIISVELGYPVINDFEDMFDLNAVIKNTGAKLRNAVATLILPEGLETEAPLIKQIGTIAKEEPIVLKWNDINAVKAGLWEMKINIKGVNFDLNEAFFVSIKRIELDGSNLKEEIYSDETSLGSFSAINFNPNITYTNLYYSIEIIGPENYSYDKNLWSLHAGETKHVEIIWDNPAKELGEYFLKIILRNYYGEPVVQTQNMFTVINRE